MKACSFCLILFFLCCSPVNAEDGQDLMQDIANGAVNWTKGYILSKGIGAPPENAYGKPHARPLALRAAKLDAMRNLLEVVNGVRIDSQTLVKNFAVESDIIRAQVEGTVRGAQIVKQEYMSDGTVEVTIRMNLYGDFSQLVFPRNNLKPDAVPPTIHLKRKPAPARNAGGDDAPLQPSAAAYTGLVVDARGLGASPAMAPNIVDESGQQVYGTAFVDREYAVQHGMSGYAKDIDGAINHQRVTDNPLMIKGKSVQGPGRSDIVISNEDALKLRSASEHLSFLKKCRVMVVVD